MFGFSLCYDRYERGKMQNNSSIGEIIIYMAEDGQANIEVKLKDETIWLSLNQISDLFGRDKSVISRHISNVFKEGELDRKSVVAISATTP